MDKYVLVPPLQKTQHFSFSSHRYNLRLCYEAKCLSRRLSWGTSQLLLFKYLLNQLSSNGFIRHDLVSSRHLFHFKALQRAWPASHAPFPLSADRVPEHESKFEPPARQVLSHSGGTKPPFLNPLPRRTPISSRRGPRIRWSILPSFVWRPFLPSASLDS